ncbi:putative FG-GAP repeat protein [Xylariaceae sp. AK1471]|nr:putative FG-GAP repeat protein [Xylariaceae sp. AK1471]
MVSSKQLLSSIGCFLSLASLTVGLPQKPNGGLLKSRQAPYQTRILDTGTTFGLEINGVWQLIDATGDRKPDLAYIKTQFTATGKVEVHIASSSSNFQQRTFEAGTTFGVEVDGTWMLVPSKNSALPDLAFIKTSNTPSGKVEVHIASGASDYQNRTLEVATTFGIESNGAWQLYDCDGDGILDLVYIKTQNTGTGTVEVHVASGASNYAQFSLHTGTTFGLENNGYWSVAPFSASGAADLVYIKDSNTGTGQVEVHVASQASGYQTRIFEGGSAFGEERNGPKSLVDFDLSGSLDLAFVKDSNTGTGTVEVHVAAGVKIGG